ncbi:MAG TPA: general stress protein [Acidimicrobiales bacterium]|nr:general stress protein [Acidimicrobiales bacterium]
MSYDTTHLTVPAGMGEVPRVTAWNTVASYATYREAHDAVDRLASVGFPVEDIEIVGSGLRSVERVTGRVSVGSAILGGIGSGAWVGLFVGLLVGLFTVGPAWLGLIVGGILIGAAFGAVAGLAAGVAARRRGEYSALHSVVATRYDVIALDNAAGAARSALGLGGAADFPPPPAS